MRRLLVAAGALLLVAAACVDLFHSTATKSLCDIDANAPGCVEAGPPTLCDAGDPESVALRACAWLSACAHPVGRNMTGQCMVDAVLAYDCAANPNRPPQGKAKKFWQCMLGVKVCDDVIACVFPNGRSSCTSGGFIGCSQTPGTNDDTRYDCVVGTADAGDAAPPAPGENCAMAGQTCDSLDRDAMSGNNSALCLGPARRTCSLTGCADAGALSLCDDAGLDRGYDCTSVGAQQCDDKFAAPTCDPINTGLGSQAPSTDVTCTSGNVRARGSITGVIEQVDCTPISGSGSCVPIEGGAPGVVPSDACWVADAGCDADTCDTEGGLSACVRGRVVPVNCVALGLGTCDVIHTNEGFPASCTAP